MARNVYGHLTYENNLVYPTKMTSIEKYNCIFCQDSFDSKEELQIHFRKHGDPKFNQNLKNKPQAEMAGTGDKVDDGEVVSCDVCDEVFPTISKAITHKHKTHPDHDAKYFCPWCGKLFTMKHLYNKHIQSMHDSQEQTEEMGFHCDYCEVDFFIPSAMVYHNKFFHRQDTELAAIGHSKKLKMFAQEPLQIYYCPFCGEEYCNKVNLHKHMGDDHIDENQSPEDVLRCPLCEAVFYHLDAYELHLTFHSTEDQYSEENELIKEITEFSLETVPPIMEKVENESQEDEAGGSMGIEELLQQGMNDSNDNEANEEPRKKKKHKKHKKSKKTITLDEFLNMHSDVLGEDLDVQGIVEVPSQVVTKQLRKPQQPKLKPGPKPLPAELAKLKKAGLVIKKKPSAFQGMKITNKNIKNPVINKAQVANKFITPTQTKPEVKTSSNDILSKILSQTNSQIKIVKKSAESVPTSEILPANRESSENKESENMNEDDNEKSNDENGGTNRSNNEKIVKNVMEDCSSHEISSQDSDNHCSTKFNSQLKKDNTTKDHLEEDAEDPLNQDYKFVQPHSDNVAKTTANGNTINTLRNISQHITIKSVPSPKSVQKPSSVMENANDENIDESSNEDLENIKLKESLTENTKSNPLTALQHLSHLTVKSNKPPPVQQAKIANLPKVLTSPTVLQKDTDNRSANIEYDDDEQDYETEELPKSISPAVKNVQISKNTLTQNNPLKNLGKHITVKSMPPSPNSSIKLPEKPDFNENDSENELDLAHLNVNKNSNKNNENIPKKQSAVKSVTSLKSPKAQLGSTNHSPKVQTQLKESEVQGNELVLYNPKSDSNVNILKQLPNITAKPINVAKNLTEKVTVQSSTQSVNVQQGNLIKNSVKKIETQKKEEIEIFNIDDSDEEESGPQKQANPFNKIPPVNSSNKNIETNSVQNKSLAALKNLSKHITIKPKNTKPTIDESFEYENEIEEEPHAENSDFEDHDVTPQSLDNEINSILQNKLKSLGNLTMKSKPSLQKITHTSTHSSPKVNNNVHIEEYDSDPDLDTPSKVKITELPDDYPSDDDIPLQKIKNLPRTNKNEEWSDQETHNEDEEDIETLIKPTKVIKSRTNLNKKPPACLNKLTNLTVKSLRDNKVDPEDEEIPEDINDDNTVLPNKNKKLPIRPNRQDASVDESQEPPNKPVKQQLRRTINNNASTSANQINTVNKEVTVQTFQSQTVIEEITTTVTKTIRTVNQSSKQEFQNISQNMTMPVRPQKIQGIRPNQQVKNFQGMSVRPATPIRPRMRNPVMTPRAPAVGNVRPFSQLVPVRPGVNVARLSNPRMPVTKKVPTPATGNSNKPIIGKPLKISPNAMMPFNKRPASDEPAGPFSCFKKPKESLIPGHGSSDFSDSDGDSAVQYASSSHMSKSNFTSMTKMVKGNSVMTSTQMKSEVSASSEQLNRLNSMSGLKVVKASQVKQASKVEEKVEVSPAKQNALSAIEKLQRQGLLVKKPRIEEPEDSDHDHSNPDDDDDYYDT